MLLASSALYLSTIKQAQSPLVSLNYSQAQELIVSKQQQQLLLEKWQRIYHYQPHSQAVLKQLLELQPDQTDQEKYQQALNSFFIR